jgi:hypothetical protein
MCWAHLLPAAAVPDDDQEDYLQIQMKNELIGETVQVKNWQK